MNAHVGLVTSTPRQQRVLDAATAVFHERGFHAATMSAIAGAADLTASGLYRHYAGKDRILAAVFDAGTRPVERALHDVARPKGHDAAGALRDTAHRLAALAAEHRLHGAIIQRDARALAADDRGRVQRRWHRIGETLAGTVRAAHPHFGADDAELAARAMLAVTASPSYFAVRQSLDNHHRDLLADMIAAVAGDHLRPGALVAAPARPLDALRHRASRREAIMSVATRLFGTHGFHSVGMEQIAAAAGVTVPTVYSYFADKATLMVTAQQRGTAWLQLAVAHAVEREPRPADTLAAILDSYADFGIQHTDNMAVLVHEMHNLPVERRPAARREQQEYLSELLRLVALARPDLDRVAHRLVVHAALGVINELTRTRRYHRRPELHGELSSMTRSLWQDRRT